MNTDAIPYFDPAHFQASPHAERREKPWGWELVWTHPDAPYVGKMLHVWKGHRMSLQMHEGKVESWLLVNGRARVLWENQHGELDDCELKPGQGYTCVAGRKHRLAGITDCDIVEVSTPEIGTTWRIEDDYGRPHETQPARLSRR